MLRQAVKDKSELGLKAGELMAQGKLVPDDLMLDLIKSRITLPDCSYGFILDGFPRTITQAEGLDALMRSLHLPEFTCIEIVVPDHAIVERLISRRLCDGCGRDYNLKTNPPPDDLVCPVCGGNIHQRKDDNEETITNRLSVYQEQTAPVRDYYSEKNHFFAVDGSRDVPDVQKDIISLLS
jgi:adenylate kinase